jgi:hypothetical protein
VSNQTDWPLEGTLRYGARYFCIKTPAAPDGEIYVMADRLEVTPVGALIAWGGFRRQGRDLEEGEAGLICLTLAPGQWTAAFAASLIDGNAIAVEHWKDEVPPPR